MVFCGARRDKRDVGFLHSHSDVRERRHDRLSLVFADNEEAVQRLLEVGNRHADAQLPLNERELHKVLGWGWSVLPLSRQRTSS